MKKLILSAALIIAGSTLFAQETSPEKQAAKEKLKAEKLA